MLAQIAISPITAPKVATAPTGMTAVGDLHLNFSVVTAPYAMCLRAPRHRPSLSLVPSYPRT